MFRFAARLQPADAACHVGSAYPDFCTQFFLNLCHPSKCLLRTFRCSLLASDTRKKFLRRFRGDARHLLWQCERSPAPTNWWQATLLHSASSPQCKPTTVNPAKKKGPQNIHAGERWKIIAMEPPEPSTTASSLHKSCASHLQQHKARCCPNLATAGCRLVQHTTWQRSSREPYQHSDTSHAWLKTTTTCTHAQNCSNTQARTHSDVFYPTALPHRQMLAR